jgi:glyoxylase-like metal-dependent hydrolase (beta-lactamase superfamily II)
MDGMTGKMIVGRLVVGPIAANCYIVGHEKTRKGMIIDAGEDADQILAVVRENNLDIRYIVATHGHFDHNGAVAKLKKELSCPFVMHEADLSFIEEAKRSAASWGFIIDDVPKPDRFIKDGDVLWVGRLRFKVIHTPGHSPGGICFYCKGEGVLFTGDTLFFGSIGRTDFRLGSLKELTHSIKEKLYTLPDDTLVYTGHGEETTIGYEKDNNGFVRR